MSEYTGVHSDPRTMHIEWFHATFRQLKRTEVSKWFQWWKRHHADHRFWQPWSILHNNVEAQPFSHVVDKPWCTAYMAFQCDRCGMWLTHMLEYEIHLMHEDNSLSGCEFMELIIDECWQNNEPALPLFITSRLASVSELRGNKLPH